MKRGLCYLFVLFGIVLVVSNVTITSADDIEIDIDTKITDAYYTNVEPDKSKLEDDIVVKFTQRIYFEFDDEFDDDDDDDDEKEDYLSRYYYYFKIDIILKIQLILPSGYTLSYGLTMSLKITDGKNYVDATLIMYNHALESGWYKIKIGSYIDHTSARSYDSLIFDPPKGSGGTDPTIELIY